MSGVAMEQKISGNSSREKRPSRKEILEKKKAIEEAIKASSANKDHLASFPSLRHYNRNGLSVYLESGCGDKLSSSLKHFIQSLLKINMEGPYGSEWPSEEKVKRREMVAPEARYIVVHDATANSKETLEMSERGRTNAWNINNNCPVVGFVHYRFTLEEELPVVYVYEIQLQSHVQGKGLGKFLMQLIEIIAQKNRMSAVMLTVQKANSSAMNFYLSKLSYNISAISPSRRFKLDFTVQLQMGYKKSYEILCKILDSEAKAKLEVCTISICYLVIL
ncbi:GNAT domain [Dillenia turbinata]|uniref:N-alpha-acetyltransferase 40 n=1 Tax=Dillenia turbinata TaxID=194707 RepID=A0AAN8YUA0_9MAGN